VAFDLNAREYPRFETILDKGAAAIGQAL